MTHEVQPLSKGDSEAMLAVINDAAEKYRGKIPPESDTDPYMPMAQLTEEMAEMRFFGVRENELLGVIGVQAVGDVTLIRHLYVRPAVQRRGIGSTLLEAGIERAGTSTILVGTWKAATWAIDFYEKHGFQNLGSDIDLLERYWEVPDHQMEASVVLRYSSD